MLHLKVISGILKLKIKQKPFSKLKMRTECTGLPPGDKKFFDYSNFLVDLVISLNFSDPQ